MLLSLVLLIQCFGLIKIGKADTAPENSEWKSPSRRLLSVLDETQFSHRRKRTVLKVSAELFSRGQDPTQPESEKLKKMLEKYVSERGHHHEIDIMAKVLGTEVPLERVVNPYRLWTNSTIPYIISNAYSEHEVLLFQEAFRDIVAETCIKFVPRTNEESYIHIKNVSKICRRAVGKGAQQMSKEKIRQSCFRHGIILHELMHVMGFVHEHNRPNRDFYIRVNETNILKNMKEQFEKYQPGEIADLDVEYDYESVMHFSEKEFAINPSYPTIIPRSQTAKISGYSTGLSRKDVEKINKLFSCKGEEESETTHDIVPEQYQDEDQDQDEDENLEQKEEKGKDE